MTIYTFLNDIVFAFLEGSIIFLFFLAFSGKKEFVKQNPGTFVVFCVFYTILSYWSTTFVPFGLHTLCQAVITFLFLSFITRTNIYNSAIITAAAMILVLIADIITSVPIIFLFQIDITNYLGQPLNKLLFSTVAKGLLFGTCFVLYFLNVNLFKIDFFKKENSLASNIILQIFLMGLFLLTVNYVSSHGQDLVLYNILLFTLYMLYIAFSFFDLKERMRLLNLEGKIKVQEEYVKNLEGVMNIIRREKHDFLNHINTIFALTRLSKPDSLERIAVYLQKITSNLQSSYKFYNTGIDFVDGLLAIKSNSCYENNINMSVEVQDELKLAAADESDLTTIIGNILNNGIEAIMLEAVKNDDSYIAIKMYLKRDKYIISISNNGPAISEKNMETIFENGFTTKKENSIDHGYGLFITKQYVNRNGGTIRVSSTEEKTEFILEFNVRQ